LMCSFSLFIPNPDEPEPKMDFSWNFLHKKQEVRGLGPILRPGGDYRWIYSFDDQPLQYMTSYHFISTPMAIDEVFITLFSVRFILKILDDWSVL